VALSVRPALPCVVDAFADRSRTVDVPFRDR
jgi:hypothetical protein